MQKVARARARLCVCCVLLEIARVANGVSRLLARCFAAAGHRTPKAHQNDAQTHNPIHLSNKKYGYVQMEELYKLKC